MYHLYTNTVLGGFVLLSVRPLYKPLSRCPISKLSTYSESSWSCRSFFLEKIYFFFAALSGAPVAPQILYISF